MTTESLKGSAALITGGGSGIGLAIAQTLAAAGASVAVAGRRAAVVEEAAAGIRQAGGEALAVQGDIAAPEAAERLVKEAATGLGGLNILINNAGIARAAPLAEMEPGTIADLIDIDLKGPIWVTRAALPFLRQHGAAGGASVVNVSSSVTQHPVPGFAVYSAAKAGLDMLTRCLAAELAADGIRVNAICPGVVETPIFTTMMPADAISEALEGIARQTPLGRVGAPEDVARLTRFLVSPAGSWMTGAVIPLDGGLSLT